MAEQTDRWFLSDCEGSLEIWREAVLRNVTRDDSGEVTGYRLPAAYKDGDLIASWDLGTWDEGEDPDDDHRRQVYADIVRAHNERIAYLARAEADERPRCGLPCLNHNHTCDRDPNHTGVHRDIQQNGQHTCEWATPGPGDLPAVLHAWKLAEHSYVGARDRWFGAADNVLATAAERDEARAEVERVRAELAEMTAHAERYARELDKTLRAGAPALDAEEASSR